MDAVDNETTESEKPTNSSITIETILQKITLEEFNFIVETVLYRTGTDDVLTEEEESFAQHKAIFGGTTREEWDEKAYQNFANLDNGDAGTLYKILAEYLANDIEPIKKTLIKAYNRRSKELMKGNPQKT